MASVARTRPLNLLIDYHERGHPGSPTPSFAACSEARPRQGRRRACAPPSSWRASRAAWSTASAVGLAAKTPREALDDGRGTPASRSRRCPQSTERRGSPRPSSTRTPTAFDAGSGKNATGPRQKRRALPRSTATVAIPEQGQSRMRLAVSRRPGRTAPHLSGGVGERWDSRELGVVALRVPIWDAGEPSRPLEVSILRVRGAQQSPRRFLAAFLGHRLEIEKEILLNIY